MAGNLTRDEARARARLLTVESYEVALDLTRGEDRFESVTTIRFTGADPGASTFVDLHDAHVREIVLNGTTLDVAAYDADKGRFPLPSLSGSNELRMVADCAYTRTGEGLHRFVDPVDQHVYLASQFETADAHRVYACFDQPDLKATVQFTVLAPADWEVISNATADDVREVATPAHAQGGMQAARRWRFATTPVMSTYVTALVAGPYHKVVSEHDGIPLGLYCRASLAEHLDADNLFEITRLGFDFFHRVFGVRYPFGKYDQCFVPELHAGAMENAGCVTLLDDYLFRSRITDAVVEWRAKTMLHEMAHMWLGDLVTMRWWDDLWLNESFATYMSVLAQAEATRWTTAWTTFANVEKSWAYRQDQLPSSHPVVADVPDMRAVELNFDGITYAKGASVLKQLVAYVGLENFIAGVRGYVAEHAWGNTELKDLLDALERTSRRDLSAWSKEWLETAWVNTLRPEFEVSGGRFARFEVAQEASDEHPTRRAHRIAIGLYSLVNGRLTRTRRVELDVVGARTSVPQLVGAQRPDLVLLNDDDLTYAKIRLDEVSLRTLVDGGIARFTESLPRALCWSAAWDMTRDGEMAARDYVKLVVSGGGTITDIMVLQTVLRQARTAALQYADPAWRSQGLALLSAELRSLLASAAPASDHQLAYAQAFAPVAGSAADLDLLEGILDGSAVPEGLSVDADLRWNLVQALVSGGRLDSSDIEAELALDPTATGERSAAQCRAAIPTAEAKSAAWERIVSGEVANHLARATIGGLQDPLHPELLEPYREKYFAEVGRIYQERTFDQASSFAVGCFPSLLVSEETRQAADGYLAAQEPPPALRRMILECADNVRRALRNREVDAISAAPTVGPHVRSTQDQ
ncbi:aminopeptidase N [Virgisporangium aurantiacum]|uniref:Aminopeptidase N n=1 Tax=Virgisporangium aurantiacum TaxID=175570 RepID=A0A8J4E5D6_9ACTN|nr:aminopeptidase N [Virgisporangium aurantiacum]GIJ62171.1 aminopeptidase N [Virgisporangium aurantiacum]